MREVGKEPRQAVQAWGCDARSRKQYRYHARAVEQGQLRKYYRVRELAKELPELRRRIRRDAASREPSRHAVAAAVVQLVSESFFRIGSERYLEENRTFGIATLLKRHVEIADGRATFTYVGKQSIRQRQIVANRSLARLVARHLDSPGARLFRYRDGRQWRDLTARDVNAYLRERLGVPFSAKDFRTWVARCAPPPCSRSSERRGRRPRRNGTSRRRCGSSPPSWETRRRSAANRTCIPSSSHATWTTARRSGCRRAITRPRADTRTLPRSVLSSAFSMRTFRSAGAERALMSELETTPDAIPVSESTATHRTISNRVAVAIIALAAMIPFLPTLRAGFIYDDTTIVRDNALLRGWSALARVWGAPYWPTVGNDVGLYRPLHVALLAAVWNLGGGSPRLFHLYAIALHVIVAVVLWRLLGVAVGRVAAIVGALWFATHALHVETVASVANSSELLVALFTMVLAAVIVRAERVEGTAREWGGRCSPVRSRWRPCCRRSRACSRCPSPR